MYKIIVYLNCSDSHVFNCLFIRVNKFFQQLTTLKTELVKTKGQSDKVGIHGEMMKGY